MDAVRGLAEGRFWTGRQALENGLVDALGGIEEALALARSEAGLPEGKRIRLIQYSRRRSLRDLISLPLLESLARWPGFPIRSSGLEDL